MSPWLIGLDIVFLIAVVCYFYYHHLKRKYIRFLMEYQTRLAELMTLIDDFGNHFGTSEQCALLFKVNILARRVRTLGDYRHLLQLFSASIAFIIADADNKGGLRREYLHRLALAISALNHLESFSIWLTKRWSVFSYTIIRIPVDEHNSASYRRFICRLMS